MLLSDLPTGKCAIVEAVVSSSEKMQTATLQHLKALGFIQGEPVQILRRGLGGREPLAVQIGETLFALRLLEAQCIQVRSL